MYADDCTILVAAQTSEMLQEKINEATNDFIKWSNANFLIHNAEKTVYTQFYNRTAPTTEISLAVDGKQIKQSDKFKFLGISLIDSAAGRSIQSPSLNKIK